mgnify:FL=1
MEFRKCDMSTGETVMDIAVYTGKFEYNFGGVQYNFESLYNYQIDMYKSSDDENHNRILQECVENSEAKKQTFVRFEWGPLTSRICETYTKDQVIELIGEDRLKTLISYYEGVVNVWYRSVMKHPHTPRPSYTNIYILVCYFRLEDEP